MADQINITYNEKDLPLLVLAVLGYTKDESQDKVKLNSTGTDGVQLTGDGSDLKESNTIARFLTKKFTKSNLYDSNVVNEIDQWVDFAAGITSVDAAAEALNNHLQVRSVLAGYKITLADLAVWAALKKNTDWEKFSETNKTFVNLNRWFKFIEYQPKVKEIISKSSGTNTKEQAKTNSRTGTQGSFSNLSMPGAEMGKVVTRFPPEPSGYLHIGHAKAAFMNNYYANYYKGKLIIRFDDTNPSKEKVEFVDSILQDLKTLGITGSHISYTSDFFPQIQSYAEKLLKEGKAFIDTTDVETMRLERQKCIPSKCRDQTVEENLRLWGEMLKGSEEGLKCVMRGKLDMNSKNGVLRDPSLYRCNTTHHHRTGSKYKAYPLYDFAVPVVDSIEGVTHALRSSEYHDRNPLYDWVCDVLEIRKPFIQDFSRLNFTYTLLSKRKLQKFVDSGLVPGWNDPRFPTVQGLLRRGLTVEALTEFILSQGASKSLNLMEIEKLWAVNKKVIDPVVPRYTAQHANNRAKFILSDGPKTPESKSILKHKKNASLGNKTVTYTSTIFLEGEDAKNIKQGEEVTLMDWGNAVADKITTDAQGVITIEGHLNLAGDFKTTEKKLTWLADIEDNVKVNLVEYSHLITKSKLEEDDNLDNFINYKSKDEVPAIGDPNLRTLAKGDKLQLERRGYYICDEPYVNSSKPIVLILIPDGHTTKAQSTLTAKSTATTATGSK